MITDATQRRAPHRPVPDIPPDLGLRPPYTTEERLVYIRALGQRIEQHVRFMCGAGNLGGTSQEAKDKAISVFYERLRLVEQQLNRIHQDLELG